MSSYRVLIAVSLGLALVASPLWSQDDEWEVTKPDGLQWTDATVGEGDEAISGSKITVHYDGYLTDGKKFDSSRDRDAPFEFTLGRGEVIKGWDLGFEGMKVGGQRKLRIPSELGYGASGAGGGLIPPDATLIFDVELLEVVPPATR